MFLRHGFSCPDEQATLNPLVLFYTISSMRIHWNCVALFCFRDAIVDSFLPWEEHVSLGTWWDVIHVIHPESLIVLGVIQGSQPCADLPNRKLEGHPNDRNWFINHGDRNSPISRVMKHLDMALVYPDGSQPHAISGAWSSRLEIGGLS